MTARDIEYVELYSDDGPATAGYFTSAMGFTRVASSEAPDRESVLLQQGRTRLVVTTGPATWKFLDEHGVGVADIAFGCDDVKATRAAAVAAGASARGESRGHPVVSGYGGMQHTLVPAAPEGAWRLPAGREWTELPERIRADGPAAGEEPPDRILALDHVALCVAAGALQAAADFYHAAFGLDRYSAEYFDVGDQAMDSIVVRSPSGGVTFTLVAPDATKSPGQLDEFLERNGGPGVQHLAFLVADIVPAVLELRRRGVDFLSAPDAYYLRLVERFPELGGEVAGLRSAQVLADRDEWGYLLQLFTRSPHARRTLFYELIQRRGSRGFGSANFKAMYEAVERERRGAE